MPLRKNIKNAMPVSKAAPKKKFAPGKKITRTAPKPNVKKVDAIVTRRAPKKAAPRNKDVPALTKRTPKAGAKKFAKGKKFN